MRHRPVRRDDVPALAGLVVAALATHRARAVAVPDVAQEALAWDLRLARAGAWAMLAEADGGEVAGVVVWAPGTGPDLDDDGSPGVAHLSTLAVAPGHAGCGVGGGLLEAAVRAMAGDGWSRARLWTIAGSPAEGFYARRGWTPDGARDPHTQLGPLVRYARDLR